MSQTRGRDDDVDEVEETGLNLFDDRASAAGSFPHTMLGYDRPTVDSYVRDLEQQVATLKQLTRRLRTQVTTTQLSVGDSDFTRLGAHATALLRAAEAQSNDLVSKAGIEAERIKEEGRRVASDLRANAQAEADDVRVSGMSNLRTMREELERQNQAILDQARTEASASLEAAKKHAEALINEAQHKADMIVAGATGEAQRIRHESEREIGQATLNGRNEASDLLRHARAEAEQIISAAQAEATQLRTKAQHDANEATQAASQQAHEITSKAQAEAVTILDEARKAAAQVGIDAHDAAQKLASEAKKRADEVNAQISAMLAEATTRNAESTAHLQAQADEAAKIRAEALDAAEQTRANAARESDGQVQAAHRHAAMMKDRLEEQFAWRKEQLERETNALLQRKDTALAQLNTLKALAEQSGADFPDADPFASQPDEQTESTAQVWLQGGGDASKDVDPAEHTQLLARGTQPPSTDTDDDTHAQPAVSGSSESLGVPDESEEPEHTAVLPPHEG